MDEPSTITILKWAAGAVSHLPDGEGADVDALLCLIDGHRLAHRFLHRFIQERPDWCSKLLHGLPSWCSPSFMDCVFGLRAEARRRVELQMEALWEIRQALAHDEPVITVKGFSTYALTGSPVHVRFSGDLDLFHREPDQLCSCLKQLGYVRTAETGYHLGRMTRGEVVIEVHQWFPVWTYPPGVCTADLDPSNHPGAWKQAFTYPEETQITYQDLVENVTTGVTADTAALAVPNLEAAVLIHCAHIFRHHVDPPLRSWWPLIRLGDFADLRDLLLHPRFEQCRLLSLIEKHRAHDSVTFVGHLMQEYFGVNLLPAAADDNERPFRPPHLATHFGCWAALNSAAELLVAPDPQETIRKLGTNVIEASGGQQRHEYTTSAGADMSLIRRTLVQSNTCSHFPLELAVAWEERTLVFEIRLPAPPEPRGRYHLNIFYDLTSSPWQVAICQGLLTRDDYEESTVRPDADGCLVRVPIKWQRIPEALRRNESMYIVLTVFVRNGDPTWRFGGDPVMAIPMQIVRRPASGERTR